eukprot:scaffold1828_cov258-Pinguiococcus_pyrenoidosus.AAC.3
MASRWAFTMLRSVGAKSSQSAARSVFLPKHPQVSGLRSVNTRPRQAYRPAASPFRLVEAVAQLDRVAALSFDVDGAVERVVHRAGVPLPRAGGQRHASEVVEEGKRLPRRGNKERQRGQPAGRSIGRREVWATVGLATCLHKVGTQSHTWSHPNPTRKDMRSDAA